MYLLPEEKYKMNQEFKTNIRHRQLKIYETATLPNTYTYICNNKNVRNWQTDTICSLTRSPTDSSQQAPAATCLLTYLSFR